MSAGPVCVEFADGIMKAIVYTQYGSPDVLQLKDVEKPTPRDDEVLIRIYAASANPADWHLMRAEPFLARIENGLLEPRNTKLGADVAGRVEAVGRTVTEFQVGDDVFGCLSSMRWAVLPSTYVSGKMHWC